VRVGGVERRHQLFQLLAEEPRLGLVPTRRRTSSRGLGTTATIPRVRCRRRGWKEALSDEGVGGGPRQGDEVIAQVVLVLLQHPGCVVHHPPGVVLHAKQQLARLRRVELGPLLQLRACAVPFLRAAVVVVVVVVVVAVVAAAGGAVELGYLVEQGLVGSAREHALFVEEDEDAVGPLLKQR